MNALSRGALVAGVAGVALFIAMFLGWFGESGWDAFGWPGIAILLAAVIAALSFAVVTYTGVSVSLPIALASISAGFGFFAFVAVLYRLIDPPGSGEIDRELGLYLGLLAAAGILAGGYLGMQDDDTSLS